MNFFEWLSKVRATKDLSVHPRTEHSRSVVVYKLENAYIYIYIYRSMTWIYAYIISCSLISIKEYIKW